MTFVRMFKEAVMCGLIIHWSAPLVRFASCCLFSTICVLVHIFSRVLYVCSVLCDWVSVCVLCDCGMCVCCVWRERLQDEPSLCWYWCDRFPICLSPTLTEVFCVQSSLACVALCFCFYIVFSFFLFLALSSVSMFGELVM